jgi:hypothetical protein
MQLGLSALPGDQGNRLLSNRDEGFAAKPMAVIGDDAVGEVAAGLEHAEARRDRRAIDDHVARFRSAGPFA